MISRVNKKKSQCDYEVLYLRFNKFNDYFKLLVKIRFLCLFVDDGVSVHSCNLFVVKYCFFFSFFLGIIVIS